MQKRKQPRYRVGDLVQFKYDFGGKATRIVCIERPVYDNDGEWNGWYIAHLFYDSHDNWQDPAKYKLEELGLDRPLPMEETRKTLIARLGE